jgi:hypothetical protein
MPISTTADLTMNGSDGFDVFKYIDEDTLEAMANQLIIEACLRLSPSWKPIKTRSKKMHDPNAPKKPSSSWKPTKKMHDPNAPKKPKTAFMIFQWSEHGVPKIKSENDGIAHTAAVSRSGAIWKGMSDDARAPFSDEAKGLHSNWLTAKAAYVSENPTPTLVEKANA